MSQGIRSSLWRDRANADVYLFASTELTRDHRPASRATDGVFAALHHHTCNGITSRGGLHAVDSDRLVWSGEDSQIRNREGLLRAFPPD